MERDGDARHIPGGLAMLIEITCRRCGQAYTPTVDDFRRGPEVYQRCPACRPVDVAGENTE
jgi:hypothetical protein